jgi:hypothetical protein
MVKKLDGRGLEQVMVESEEKNPQGGFDQVHVVPLRQTRDEVRLRIF